MAFGAPDVVLAPPPQPPVYSLWTSGGSRSEELPDDGAAGRWLNGAALAAYPSGKAGRWDQCNPSSSVNPDGSTGGGVKVVSGVRASGTFGAFTVYAATQCTVRGVASDAADQELRDMTAAWFRAVEVETVEREVWNGTLYAAQPFLTDASAVVANAGAPLSGTQALARIEDEIASRYGRRGMIHTTPGMVTVLGGLQIDRGGVGQLQTRLGTHIVPGMGYVNGRNVTGAAALTAGQEWLIATGMFSLTRGPLRVAPDARVEAIDRALNNVTYYAERDYLVAWDNSMHVAVLATRT